MPFNHSLHPTTDRPTGSTSDAIHHCTAGAAKEEAKDTDTDRTKPPASSLTSTINAHCVCTCPWVCGWLQEEQEGFRFVVLLRILHGKHFVITPSRFVSSPNNGKHKARFCPSIVIAAASLHMCRKCLIARFPAFRPSSASSSRFYYFFFFAHSAHT